MHVPRDAQKHDHEGAGGRHCRVHHGGWCAWLAVLACAVVVVQKEGLTREARSMWHTGMGPTSKRRECVWCLCVPVQDAGVVH